VTSAVFSHNGDFIVTASSDKTVRIWNAANGEEQSVLRGHTDKVQSVETSPDDRFILSASSDRTARISLASIDEILALAKTRVTRALSCDEWQIILQEASYCPGGGITQSAGSFPTSAPVTRAALVGVTTNPIPTVAPPSGEPPVTIETADSSATARALPASPPPPPTAEPTEVVVTATIEAPTVTLPTALPTEVPPATAEPEATPTEALPTSTATDAAPTPPPLPTAPPDTPTPVIAPGVYITRLVYAPLDAPNFQFQLTFLNTTGAPVTYALWRVPFFEPGVRNSIGAPKGLVLTIPEGTTELLTEPWKVGVGQCTSYTGRPVWEDLDGRQTPLLLTGGQESSIEFQICP
jgi:hypothetical protein